MYLGSGVYGARAAAILVFGKELYDLEREQCAFIAAMMVYPRPSHPTPAWAEKVGRRTNYGIRLYSKLATNYKQNAEQ